MSKVIFVETETAALDLFREAGKEGLSNNALVRAVIDEKLGNLSIATVRPQGERAERVVKIETNDPVRAKDILTRTPGVTVLDSFVNV